MKIKLDAYFVKEKAEIWLARRNNRISREYGIALDEAMKPSFSNLWKGRSKDKAINLLDSKAKHWWCDNYFEYLDHKGGYFKQIVEDALTCSEFSINNGDGFVWIDKDDLFFLES